MSNHVCIGPGGRFQCNHCGATHDPFKGGSVEIWALSALGREFTKQHARCPEPRGPLCAFCFSPGHVSDEHVNATTRSPADWWNCGDTGLSSQAIFEHMSGMPARDSYPLDPDDFGRCYRLLNAPWAAAWKSRLPEMTVYGRPWARLVERWADMERLYVEELPNARAPKLYAMMKKLIADAPTRTVPEIVPERTR